MYVSEVSQLFRNQLRISCGIVTCANFREKATAVMTSNAILFEHSSVYLRITVTIANAVGKTFEVRVIRCI